MNEITSYNHNKFSIKLNQEYLVIQFGSYAKLEVSVELIKEFIKQFTEEKNIKKIIKN